MIDDETDDLDHDWAVHDCYLHLTEQTHVLIEIVRHSPDMRLAVTAAYVLAFIPWHASNVASELLVIALDEHQHLDFRSSCLLSASRIDNMYRSHAIEWYERNVEGNTDQNSRPLNRFELAMLNIAREIETSSMAKQQLSRRYADHGYRIESNLYPDWNQRSENLDDYRPDRIPPSFPWGNLTWQLRDLKPQTVQTDLASIRSRGNPKTKKKQLFDPTRYHVVEGDFTANNVQQAVLRYHYNRFCGGTQLSEEHISFVPFIEHVPAHAWTTVLALLNHENDRQRSCAADWSSNLRGLRDDQIDELLDGLFLDGRVDYISLLGHQSLSREHCLRLMEAIKNPTLSEKVRQSSLYLWQGAADEDLLWQALDSFPESIRLDVLRALGQRSSADYTDERLLKLIVSDLQSDEFAKQAWARSSIRRNDSVFEGLLQHADALSDLERRSMLREFRSSGNITREFQTEILSRFDSEIDQHTKLCWLMLVGKLSEVNDDLLDWLESRYSECVQTASEAASTFEYGFVEVIAELLVHGGSSTRILAWLFERSRSGNAAIRRKSRRCVITRSAIGFQESALKMIEDGLSDVDIANRRDAMFSLYRVLGNNVNELTRRLESLDADILPGDRDMVLDLARSSTKE